MAKCVFTQEGKDCGANAVNGSDYCVNHEPSLSEKMKLARKKGGSVSYYRDGLVPAEPIDFYKYQEAVVHLLADTINRVRRIRPDGSIDIKVANCIGFLVAKMLEAQKQVVFEERLVELEERLRREEIVK